MVEYLPGWGCDISGVRTWEDLPEAARKYVEYIEKEIGCRIGYVSVGPERDAIIIHGILSHTPLNEMNDKLFSENERTLF